MGSKNKKEFDAVEMSRRLRREMSKKLAGMSGEEIVAYFKKVRQEFIEKNCKTKAARAS